LTERQCQCSGGCRIKVKKFRERGGLPRKQADNGWQVSQEKVSGEKKNAMWWEDGGRGTQGCPLRPKPAYRNDLPKKRQRMTTRGRGEVHWEEEGLQGGRAKKKRRVVLLKSRIR